MDDPLSHLPGYALRRASIATMADFNAKLQPLGLRSTEASLMMLIGANPGIRQSELGRVLDIKRANMSPLIAKLEERHLICRTPIDGRSTGLSLSDAGGALRDEVQRVVEAHEAALISRVSTGLRTPFVQALRMLWT